MSGNPVTGVLVRQRRPLPGHGGGTGGTRPRAQRCLEPPSTGTGGRTFPGASGGSLDLQPPSLCSGSGLQNAGARISSWKSPGAGLFASGSAGPWSAHPAISDRCVPRKQELRSPKAGSGMFLAAFITITTHGKAVQPQRNGVATLNEILSSPLRTKVRLTPAGGGGANLTAAARSRTGHGHSDASAMQGQSKHRMGPPRGVASDREGLAVLSRELSVAGYTLPHVEIKNKTGAPGWRSRLSLWLRS